MLLAIDVGNTNIVFAIFDDGRVRFQWRATTVAQRTADEYASWFTQLLSLEGLDFGDVDAAIISSVVPQVMFDLKTFCRRYCRVEPVVVGENAELGLTVNVERPNEVGADRLVNAVAAHAKYPGALLVIDFGTATTFDLVAADGTYEGGVIAPGANLSLRALHMAAAKLPHIAVERPANNRIVGKDTVTAMQAGVYWGYVGMIEGMIRRIRAEYGQPLTVVATGGLAGLFADGAELFDEVDPELTTEGLLLIHSRTRRELAA